MTDFEKLGVFYLGRGYDLTTRQPKDDLVLYSSKDLVTHAVCVGMTGSGKTGLCISLLEEAAIDGIPALIIDPKGDLGNLLLTFPNLTGEEFLPWINPEDAARKGMAPAEFAASQAELWKNGLAKWGQDGARIARLKQSADFTIFTPGSTAGVPVSVLKSFGAPSPELAADREQMRERITATATALLALVGIDADPIQSREHILISTILDCGWKQQKDLDLAALIQQIQTPPVSRIGVLDLDAFYPAKERFKLAMALNNLLASPGFEVWLEGEPLDVGNLLYTPEGKPRHSIFSIAHLNDAERMFFVSLLLNQTLSWMRAQAGTTSLRALLYMDEIFGYFPPVQNPPSKTPLLTLLKQGRAFGLGVVLATQNPVDLDYKGLSNAGTWFIGRLQTDRDKQRVLDGLEGAAATAGGAHFDRGRMEQILAGLGNRIFLMNNVHEEGSEIFETRWALSYLRGPITRNQIRRLMESKKPQPAPVAPTPPPQPALKSAPVAAIVESTPPPPTPVYTPPVPPPQQLAAAAPTPAIKDKIKPLIPPGIDERFAPAGANPIYEPFLLASAQVRFVDLKKAVDETRDVTYLVPFTNGAVPVNFDDATEAGFTLDDLESAPAEGADYTDLPSAASQARNYKTWTRDFQNWLAATQCYDLFYSPTTAQHSKPGEAERDFRLRMQQAAREYRDTTVEALRDRYAPKIRAIEDRIFRAQQAQERERDQARNQQLSSVLSIGGTVLGAIFGGSKRTTTKVLSEARGLGRVYKETQDVDRAGESVERLKEQRDALNQELEEQVRLLQSGPEPMTEPLETIQIKPKKTNITIRLVGLVWKA
ncbi:MAG: ATP-binding protein [Bryobacterales bacterium]|nr:ATP-binding protein [Bryobacterales bacterium]